MGKKLIELWQTIKARLSSKYHDDNFGFTLYDPDCAPDKLESNFAGFNEDGSSVGVYDD